MLFWTKRWGGLPNTNGLGAEGMTPVRAGLEVKDVVKARKIAFSLLGDGGDVNAPQLGNDTVLHAAVRLGDPEIVRLVLRKRAKLGVKNDRGITPLDIAKQQGQPQIIAMLEDAKTMARDLPRDNTSSRLAYQRGGQPYEPVTNSKLSQTVINEFSSICHGNFRRVRAFLKKYPGIVHTNASWDEMGVEAGAHMGRHDIAEIVLEKGAPCALPTCVMMGLERRARAMLEANANLVRERGPHDFPLMWYPHMAKDNHVALAQMLLDFGADVDQESRGFTCLHRCARLGNAELAAFLIEQGADRNRVGRGFDGQQGTPLALAEKFNQQEVAKLLRSRCRILFDEYTSTPN